MTLVVRTLAEADQSDWRRLWAAYLEFYETALPDVIFDLTFARNLDVSNTSQKCWVAERDGTLCGLVHTIQHAHNWHANDVIYLQDLYADPQVRGQGIGRALIEAVYKYADANGTPSVYWMTQDFNVNARKLYDRIGTLTPFIKYNR